MGTNLVSLGDALALLLAHDLVVLGGVPLTEGCGVNHHNRSLGQRVGTHKLLVRGVVHNLACVDTQTDKHVDHQGE